MKKWTQSLLAGAFLLGVTLPTQAAVLPSGSHCVAYKTQKTLALVKKVTVIGKNCSISVTAKKLGGKFAAVVSIPIKRFNSGEKDRDKEVLNILKAKKQANLVYTTQAYSKADWMNMLKKGKATVKGNLVIAGRKYPLSSTATVKKLGSKIVVSGKIVTKFTKLGIPAPSVGPGGSIAKVKDYLELHYNLSSKSVKNMGIVK